MRRIPRIGGRGTVRQGAIPAAILAILLPSAAALAQGAALSDRARQMDANGNGVIDRAEARGPLQANFDRADTDKSGALDGTEIGAFFRALRGGGAGGGRPTVVSVDVVKNGPAGETVPVYGRLVARQKGVVAARVQGAVAEMRADVGDRVAAGDALALLVADTLRARRALRQAELAEATARQRAASVQLDQARSELDRLKRLRKSAAFSKARYEDKVKDVSRRSSALAETRARTAQARAALDMADIDLRGVTIRAPFAGVVSRRHTDMGAFLKVGDRVATLINDAALEVEAEIPSNRLAGLAEGAALDLEFEDGTPFKAVVRAVIPEEDPLARTRTVRLVPDFAGEDARAAVNQSVLLNVPLSARLDVVSVHKDAVIRRSGGSAVFVVEDGRAALRAVRLGDVVGGRFEVLEGLKAGELTVVRGNERLRPGQAVRTRGDPRG